MTAGGYDPNAREVWQEAFRIPPLKLVDRGELRRDVWELVRANIRLDIVAEDVKSMIGACTIGKRRLLDVLDRYGVETFEQHMEFVIDASERLVRAEIERWPDGVYGGESWMVSDGLDPTRRYRVAVKVTIAGTKDGGVPKAESIEVDDNGKTTRAESIDKLPKEYQDLAKAALKAVK